MMALRQISSLLLRSVTPTCGLLSREAGLLKPNPLHLINGAKPISSLSTLKMTIPAANPVFGRCCSYFTSAPATLRLLGTSPTPKSNSLLIARTCPSSLLKAADLLLFTSTRNVIKCSLGKGKRRTVKSVIYRMYRLDWGAWISPKPGRARHLWKKSAQRRQRGRFHIFRKCHENKMLDRMVSKYWIKKKYFVDDPYETYHTRDNFNVTKGVQGLNSIGLFRTKRHVNPRKSPFS